MPNVRDFQQYPPDEHLIALGKLAVQSSRLDFNIQLLIWIMAGLWPLSTTYAGAVTADKSSKGLRWTIDSLSAVLFKDDKATLKRFNKLAEKYGEHCSRRGELIHAFWVSGLPLDIPQAFAFKHKPGYGIESTVKPKPTTEVLDAVRCAIKLKKKCKELCPIAGEAREAYVKAMQEKLPQQDRPSS